MAILSLTDFAAGSRFAIATDKNSTLAEYISDSAIKKYLYEIEFNVNKHTF